MFLFYVITPWLFPLWGVLENFAPWGTVSHVFWNPVWLISVLHISAPSAQLIESIQIVWRAALLFSCIGLFTRVSTALSFALGVYLFGVASSFGKIHHMDHVLIFSFLIMAFSRCGDAWSVDALIRKRRASKPRNPVGVSSEYTWPVRMIWVVIVLIYFAAGISKMRHSGFAWITSDTMSKILIWHSYHTASSDPITRWGPMLSRSVVMTRILALCGMGFELALPLVLFSKRIRYVLIPSMVAMQIGIALMVGPSFYQMILCQLLWVPWDRVVAYVTRSGEGRLGNSVA
jgi:Vitamin K-dependent gamma-carboxylase